MSLTADGMYAECDCLGCEAFVSVHKAAFDNPDHPHEGWTRTGWQHWCREHIAVGRHVNGEPMEARLLLPRRPRRF